MATLEQAGKLVTKELQQSVDRLTSAVTEESPDFLQIVRLADAVGEAADAVAEIYADLEEALQRGLRDESKSNGDEQERRSPQKREQQSSQKQAQQSSRKREQQSSQKQEQKKEEPRARQQQEKQTEQNGSPAEEVTKEDLLERAREVNVHGRSSMSKDELVEAVETEESQTKEELLERAREAGIEGRSAMSKDELRKALREANA
jgi:hypothetical protein